MVQAVAAGHGGRVEVDEAPEGGAVFRLVLPRGAPEAAEPAPRAKGRIVVPDYPRLDGARLLVVDDEPLIRRVVQRCCGSRGAKLVEAQSAREAIGILQDHDFDLVLLDVRMPGGGGADVFREIRARYPRLVGRTLFMSGDLSAEMSELVGTGHAGVLAKPFDLGALLQTVDEVLAAAERAAEPA